MCRRGGSACCSRPCCCIQENRFQPTRSPRWYGTGRPPPGADVTLRSHVLRLRRVLGPRAGARLVTCSPGYLLQAQDDEVDLLRFRRLCRDGGGAARAGAWGRAHVLLGEALDLWRGAPLADIPSESLRQNEIQDLEALQLQAEEWRSRRRAAPGPPRRAGARAARPDRATPAAGTFPRPAHAGPVPVRPPGRGTGRLPARPQHPDRGTRHRTRTRTTGPAPADTVRRPRPGRQRARRRPAEVEPRRIMPRELPSAVPGFTGRSAELRALTRLLDRPGGTLGGRRS